jgi:uncharacterized membrane protein
MLRVFVEGAASLFEAAGTVVMTIGVLVAIAMTWRDRRAGAVFKMFRYRLGRAIILGLELLVAADILRTISTEPTITGVATLGCIVLIRTFLSFSLEVELEGRWPWQARAQGGESSNARELSRAREPAKDRQPDETSGGEATH